MTKATFDMPVQMQCEHRQRESGKEQIKRLTSRFRPAIRPEHIDSKAQARLTPQAGGLGGTSANQKPISAPGMP